MAHYPSQLTDEQILRDARQLLQDHLPLKAEGYSCTSTDLYHALLGVAVGRGTLEAVCSDWLHLSTAETVRGYLNEQLRVEDLAQLANQLNAALAARLPRRLKHRAQNVAIDFHDRPYYGKQPQAAGLWVRGQAKDGTTRFYRVASAYVIHHGLRFTVALHFVLPEDDTLTVLQALLKRVRIHPLTLRCLYLDKGFAGQAVVNYLTAQAIPTIIACPIRGKQGGTRALCQGRKSYRTTYTFNAGQPEAYTAALAVCRVFTTAKRTQRLARRAEWLLFIVIGVDWSPKQVQRQYRRRFGIESSYRCAGHVRGWTTSPNAAYRFVLIALSFILVNVWLHVRWQCCQIARRGGRRLAETAFQLTRLVNFLRRALERLYGYVSVLEILVPPRP